MLSLCGKLQYVAPWCLGTDPFRAPKPLPILMPSNFVPKTGFSWKGVNLGTYDLLCIKIISSKAGNLFFGRTVKKRKKKVTNKSPSQRTTKLRNVVVYFCRVVLHCASAKKKKKKGPVTHKRLPHEQPRFQTSWFTSSVFYIARRTDCTITPPKPAILFNERFMAARHKEGYRSPRWRIRLCSSLI